MRVIIDTNVLISAIFWSGKPKQLLNLVRREKIIFVTSKYLLAELKEVLTRNDKPFKLSEEDARRVLAAIRGLAEVIEPHSVVTACRDDADNRVLAWNKLSPEISRTYSTAHISNRTGPPT